MSGVLKLALDFCVPVEPGLTELQSDSRRDCVNW